MKDAYYFKHDSNARHDPKILEMIAEYGIEGYGRFWILVEMMREAEDYTLKINGKWKAFAMQMMCEPEQAEKYITDCIDNFQLFESDGEAFWSNTLKRRMAKLDDKRIKAKKAAEIRWENTDAKRKQSERNTDAILTEQNRTEQIITDKNINSLNNKEGIGNKGDARGKQKPPPLPPIILDRQAWKFKNIEKADIEIWVELFPAVDIQHEIRSMIAWIRGAGARGVKTNYRKFITAWLKRTQNEGGTNHGKRI